MGTLAPDTVPDFSPFKVGTYGGYWIVFKISDRGPVTYGTFVTEAAALEFRERLELEELATGGCGG